MPRKDKPRTFCEKQKARDKELRILFLTHAYSNVIPGGETKAAWEFSNALAERGVKVFVVTTFAKINKEPLHSNIKIYRVPFSQQSRSFTRLDMFKTFFYALPIIFLKRIDLIHLINTQGPHPFAYFKIRPYVSTVDLQWQYDNPRFREELFYDRRLKKEEFGLTEQKPSLLDKILDKLAIWFFRAFGLNDPLPKSVDLCAYRHKKLLSWLNEQSHPCQRVWFPVGVDTKKFIPEAKIISAKKDNLVFLFSGTVSKRKGVEYLIKAFNILSKKYQKVELILAGPGAAATVNFLKKLVEPRAKVKFVGHLCTSELIGYYNFADVFVAPSIGIDLGFNKSVAEAMACAKPVIINRAHDTKDLDGKIGFCVEAGSIADLVGAMEKFIKQPSIIKTMGQTARDFILKNHSWPILAERMEKAYRKLLSR